MTDHDAVDQMAGHRHSWQDTDTGWVCATCEAVVLACLHCRYPIEDSALTVCERCLDRGRRLVLDVGEDMARFPYTMLEVTGLRSPRFDMTGTPAADDAARLPFGLDRLVEDTEDVRITAAREPRTALDVLRSWASAWAKTRGEDLPWDWEEYLVSRTVWAMQNPDQSNWAAYSVDAWQVRSTVRRILGITPVQSGTPCPDCGGTTVREWQPRADRTPTTESAPATRRRGLNVEGLSDQVRCTRCRRAWDTTAHLNLAAVAALPVLPRRRPEALLAWGQMIKALGGRVSKDTVASWIYRGWLRPVLGPWPRSETRVRLRRDGTTERLYRFVDIDRLVCEQEAHAHQDRLNREASAAAADVARHLADTGETMAS